MAAVSPLTSPSTASVDTAEEFPLHTSQAQSAAVLIQSETSSPLSKSGRTKRFSLRAIAMPFVKSARNQSNAVSDHDELPKELKSARKSTETNQGKRSAHRVSFSASTEEDSRAKEEAMNAKIGKNHRRANKHLSPKGKGDMPVRRASFNDSIGRRSSQNSRKRTVSFIFDQRGVHLEMTGGAKLGSSRSKDKGHVANPRIAKQHAIAAKHARALEQIIHAGASLDVSSVESLKAKRDKKTDGKFDKTKVQMIPAVSPRKVLALKQALLDSGKANDIIGQLRFLELEERSLAILDCHGSQTEATELLQEVQADESRRVLPRPFKAICLDCTEEEADRRQKLSITAFDAEKNAAMTVSDKEGKTGVSKAEAKDFSTNNIWCWTGWLASKEAVPNASQEDKSIIKEEQAEIVPRKNGLLSNVSPISLIVSPASAAATVGAAQSGLFDAMGTLSGMAVQAANGQDQIQPPLDRMAIFIHWWGFELTLPPSSMAYLGTAHNISTSLMTILQTLAVTGGVPELLPFVRYFSSFVDMEFSAIKSQDRGHGVIIAATWLMPMAMVPRAWDYSTQNISQRTKESQSSLPDHDIPLTTAKPAFRKQLSSKRLVSQDLAHQKVNAISLQLQPVQVLASLEEVSEGSVRVK